MAEKGILILTGKRGTGKTQLACQLIKDQITAACEENPDPQHVARYMKARDLGMQIKATFSDKESTEQSIFKSLSRFTILVIDEVHEKLKTDFESKNLTHLLDLRYDAMKPTVLITNAKQEELIPLLGYSIMDRVNDGGQLLLMDWDSFRGGSNG